MKKLKKKTIPVILLFVLVVIALLAWLVPSSQERQLRAVCRVKASAAYAVAVDGGDTLYLSLHGDTLQNAWLRAADVEQTADQSGAFVSPKGYIVTSDAVVGGAADSLTDSQLCQRLERLDSALTTQQRRERSEKKELDLYAKKHSVVDDGYNEVMAYREHLSARLDTTDSIRLLVAKVLSQKGTRARLFVRMEVRCPYDTVAFRASTWIRGNGLVLAQLDTLRLPSGCRSLSVLWLGAWQSSAKLLAYNDMGGQSLNHTPATISSGDLFPAAEGGVYVNSSGNLCGIRRGNEQITAKQIVSLMRRLHSTPAWWWNGLVRWLCDFPWQSNKHASVYPQTDLPCRRMLLPDSAVYVGQVDPSRRVGQRPARKGYGTLRTPEGDVYRGYWNADTLASGERISEGGVYCGQFDALGQSEGTGVLFLPSGGCYSGEWKDGKRAGHGFASRPGHMVQCGVWKAGRFLGERMVCTADRVYGIDISRFQHEQGKKRFAINWNDLRITSLGNGRRVKGKVNYPVSYIYIKCTEGKSLLNKYYTADYRQARAHGIRTGSYHFFSVYSTGAQQAAFFLKKVRIASTDLPPVLDLEPSEEQIAKVGGEQALFSHVLVWLRTVRQHCGKKPVLYVGQQFVNRHLVNAPAELRNYDVWIARYGEYKPYVRLLHWQLTPNGRVNGISTPVDINVFNGTKEEFAQLN